MQIAPPLFGQKALHLLQLMLTQTRKTVDNVHQIFTNESDLDKIHGKSRIMEGCASNGR